MILDPLTSCRPLCDSRLTPSLASVRSGSYGRYRSSCVAPLPRKEARPQWTCHCALPLPRLFFDLRFLILYSSSSLPFFSLSNTSQHCTLASFQGILCVYCRSCQEVRAQLWAGWQIKGLCYNHLFSKRRRDQGVQGFQRQVGG